MLVFKGRVNMVPSGLCQIEVYNLVADATLNLVPRLDGGRSLLTCESTGNHPTRDQCSEIDATRYTRQESEESLEHSFEVFKY